MSNDIDRDEKVEFIAQAGANCLRNWVLAMFDRQGARWLTDEQLDEIYQAEVAEGERAAIRRRKNAEICKMADHRNAR